MMYSVIKVKGSDWTRTNNRKGHTESILTGFVVFSPKFSNDGSAVKIQNRSDGFPSIDGAVAITHGVHINVFKVKVM